MPLNFFKKKVTFVEIYYSTDKKHNFSVKKVQNVIHNTNFIFFESIFGNGLIINSYFKNGLISNFFGQNGLISNVSLFNLCVLFRYIQNRVSLHRLPLGEID